MSNHNRPKPLRPSCPRCGTAKNVQPVGVSGETWSCGKCGALLDCDPDEGGDYSTDPTKRIEQREQSERRANPHRGVKRR